MDSPIKVIYTIMDSDQKVIHTGGHEANKSIKDSQMITPDEIGSVKEHKDKPYSLVFSYIHMLNEDENKEPCPMVEIHFSVSPIALAASALKCTAEESKIGLRER